MTIRISDGRIASIGGGQVELSADIGGTRLWFRFPESRAGELRGEPFLLAGVLPAMVRGVPLVVDHSLPVARELLDGLHDWIGIMRFWPRLVRHPMTRIPIEAATTPEPVGQGVGTFFSGGVDGTWTFLHPPVPVTHAVFVRGIDFQLDNPLLDDVIRKNREWLHERGTPVVEASSNLRWVGHAFGIGWNAWNGAGLSAIAHALGFETTLIASGEYWGQFAAFGSTPLTDPLLGTPGRRIVHHGADMLRWQKLESIAREPGVLDFLRVCWQDKGWNCGKCEKCQRTMLLLHLLGIEAPTFPRIHRFEELEVMAPENLSDALYLEQALGLAERKGDRRAMRVIRQRLSRWWWRDLARKVDDGYLAGRIARWRKARSGAARATSALQDPPAEE